MNYAVMKSVFGDYWVGKTALEPNGIGIFATWDEAMARAMARNDSIDNLSDLFYAEEADADEISTEMERWIVT